MNDVLYRVRSAQQHGWTCRLPPRAVELLLADREVWQSHGLRTEALHRALRASVRGRGMRLSVGEARAIRLPAPERLRPGP